MVPTLSMGLGHYGTQIIIPGPRGALMGSVKIVNPQNGLHQTHDKKSDLKKVMTEQCQHLSPSKRKSLLKFLKIEDFLWNSRHVEYRPVVIVIKRQCGAIVLVTLSSTKGAKGHF